jgi:choline-sulfatase
VRPTNLLFIGSDQHNKRITGCYGNPVVRTPNLDALAARGTRFDNAYCTTPICVPSRASLVTGRYAHTLGSWDNATPYTGTEAASWGHRLTDRGHKVTTIGKLHFRQPSDPTGFPDQRIPMHVLEGEGDLFGILRGDMPLRRSVRDQVEAAGPGESEYTRYDRAIADEAVRWLQEEGPREQQPWALMVSFVDPHPPLIAPQEYFDLYPPDSLPLPINHRDTDWPTHPALRFKRERMGWHEPPVDEATLRRAIAAYYAQVSYLDAQVGRVLRALEESGQAESTRIVYWTDHGEMLGDHGLWAKNSMYESSAAIPLLVSGPDVPAGRAVRTPVSTVDVFPSILQAVGVTPQPADAELPGRSLFDLAREPDQSRSVFSEYHASFSQRGIFMLRDERYKLVYYAGDPPQLFDLVQDPDERRDLADDPAHARVRDDLERRLRAICDPEAVDQAARADQQRRIEAAGGAAAIIAAGIKIPYTPAPDQFDPAPVEARERAKAPRGQAP